MTGARAKGPRELPLRGIQRDDNWNSTCFFRPFFCEPVCIDLPLRILSARCILDGVFLFYFAAVCLCVDTIGFSRAHAVRITVEISFH